MGTSAEAIKENKPFRFYTRLHLSELTGLRASTLEQLVLFLKKVPDSCIYNHTHTFLLQHQYLTSEPSSDFAYWVTAILGEDRLGKDLSRIDTVKYSSIDSLRRKIIGTIGDFLRKNPLAYLNFARVGEEFHFIESICYIIPTEYSVQDLKEFIDVLNKITIDSIYFHIFEARLRLGRRTNDFSNWIETSIGDKELADRISELNPYKYALEDLRKLIIKAVKERISE